MPVCPTYDCIAIFTTNLIDFYYQIYYYQILEERPFVFLWIYLIYYRWKTLILLLVPLQIDESFSEVESI